MLLHPARAHPVPKTAPKIITHQSFIHYSLFISTLYNYFILNDRQPSTTQIWCHYCY